MIVGDQLSELSDSISVVHFMPGLPFRDGGPSRSVVRLTDSLAMDARLSIALVSHSVAGLPSIPSMNEHVFRITEYTSNSLALKSGLVDRRLLVATLANQRQDLLHTHCLWHPANHWAMRLATKNSIPLICQPRGMLEPWALNHKALKKRLALLFFQRADLERTRAFIATSAMEAESIRRFGLRQPVAIIPNGVDFPLNQSKPERPVAKPERDRVVLFLSRLHPGKGATVLVKAWAQCRLPGWRLILAGPDDGDHLSEVMRHVEQFDVSGSVEYVGELQGAAKAAAYRSADLFVLPSFGENFGMVVAEALSFGVPVITTRATPWPDLKTFDCGWWIDTGVDPLIAALREAMALPDDARSQMGKRGETLAARYQWSNSARQTGDFYRWILGRGDRPDCVMTD
ncbi:MAG: glycosyltransferase [Sulfuricellaceae bacterium]|nr:glycosyltransferase [Sulfuricellaceae bacterium]